MPEHCQENDSIHGIKKEIVPLFYDQNKNINIYLFNNYELAIVCTLFRYKEEVRGVSAFRKCWILEIAWQLTPIKTISLLCLYNNFLFFSNVAVVEVFHFLHKCQLSDEKTINYECWWCIISIFISERAWGQGEAVVFPLIIAKPLVRNIITNVFLSYFCLRLWTIFWI